MVIGSVRLLTLVKSLPPPAFVACCFVVVLTFELKSRSPWSHKGAGALGKIENRK